MAVEWSLPNRDCAMTLKNQPASPSDPFPRKFLAHTPYPRAFVRTLCNHRELAQDIATPAGPQHWALELSDARVARGRLALAQCLMASGSFTSRRFGRTHRTIFWRNSVPSRLLALPALRLRDLGVWLRRDARPDGESPLGRCTPRKGDRSWTYA
jgi:hypothetical protein